jgi:DNA-binding NarL/FixJ family response regulator
MTTQAQGFSRGGRARVLIVDDHEDLVNAWRRWLQPSYEIVGGVSNSREALASATELNPDVVVLDVLMPGLNGLEVCREIKRAMPETKVILVSAADDDQFRSVAPHVGASAFILKSSEPQELDRAIQYALVGETYFPLPGARPKVNR